MRSSTRDHNIQVLTDRMQERFGADCDSAVIAGEVRTEYERLCRESKVTQYVPILAERRVRRHLAKRCHQAGEALRP